MGSVNMTREFGIGLAKIRDMIEQQNLLITEYEMKAAMYKACFFHKNELA